MSLKEITTKRIYEKPDQDDGYRMLVDRLWPRGISKEEAKLDEWMKEISPSTELRKWFHQQEGGFKEFSARYYKELDNKPAEVKFLLDTVSSQKVTLLYGAKDETHNHAKVLIQYLRDINA